LFPPKDQYLRIEEFEKRMKQFINDMEKKMDKKIDDEVEKFCHDKFEALCVAGTNFANMEYIYQKNKKPGEKAPEEIRTYMVSHHDKFDHLLTECLIFYCKKDRIELLCKLYLQTVVMYIAFLRDTHFFGIDWGLPKDYVNGVDHIKSMAYKTHKTIELAHEYYSKYFKKLNPPRDYTIESEVIIEDEDGTTHMGYEPTEFKFDYRPLLAQMTYADPTRYNLIIIWLQPTTKEGKVKETKSRVGFGYQYRLPVSNRIYIVDFSKMKVAGGVFGPVEDGKYSVNSVTGTRGKNSALSNGLFFKCFYFTEPKNLTFRVLANIDEDAKIKMVIREIPEGKDAQNPDLSREVATKSHSENVAYKKLFESTSGPIAEFVSKQYKFENPGSVYFEAEVVGGDTRNLYTLEIIDN
ncbi:hypothetical protein CYY_010499, partial [Polysphondylium violaceum]